MERVTYKGIVDAIKTKKGFVKTYEFYPEEGKYHWDGHRECKVRMAPQDAIKMGDVCPVCKKKMTIGVLHRVELLADRKEGFVLPHSVPFTRLIPLMEIIASVRDAGVATKGVQEEYFKIVNYFGNEFAALEALEENLILASDKVLANALVKARGGQVYWKPGYDGEFGEMRWEKPKEDPKSQKSLMDF
jgi:PHP family Zn ribbon phosphoesterase